MQTSIDLEALAAITGGTYVEAAVRPRKDLKSSQWWPLTTLKRDGKVLDGVVTRAASLSHTMYNYACVPARKPGTFVLLFKVSAGPGGTQKTSKTKMDDIELSLGAWYNTKGNEITKGSPSLYRDLDACKKAANALYVKHLRSMLAKHNSIFFDNIDE